MSGIRRIFELKTYRPGTSQLSAASENHKAGVLQQIANLRTIAPLFMRHNGTGVEIGLAEQPGGNLVSYPCRVVSPLLNNEPMTGSALDTPQDPTRVTYTIRPDDRATGDVPPGIDFTVPFTVRYGRPFGSGDGSAKILVSRPNDLCFVSSYQGVPELQIIGERVATRICTPTATTPPATDPPPTPPGFAPSNSSVGFTSDPSTPPTRLAPDLPMASHSTSTTYSLKADQAEDATDVLYVGDADYVAVTGSMQLAGIKATWGRDLWVEWSADGRTWDYAQMTDPSSGTKSQAVINSDGFISIDVREGVGYVRARWDPAGTLRPAGTLTEVRFSKKRGTAR